MIINRIRYTRAKPRYIDKNNTLRSFTFGDDKTVFNAKLLRIGLDNKLYVVFDDCHIAAKHAHIFVGCEIACCGAFENAYCLDTVH